MLRHKGIILPRVDRDIRRKEGTRVIPRMQDTHSSRRGITISHINLDHLMDMTKGEDITIEEDTTIDEGIEIEDRCSLLVETAGTEVEVTVKAWVKVGEVEETTDDSKGERGIVDGATGLEADTRDDIRPERV